MSEFYGSAIFYCCNSRLLSIIDEFLSVTVIKNISEIIKSDFVFLDNSVKNIEKICYELKKINNKTIIFYCCPIEELANIEPFFDDYILIPSFREQIEYKLKFWQKKKQKYSFMSEKEYILQRMDITIQQCCSLTSEINLIFQLSSLEWLFKFIQVQTYELKKDFVSEILDFIKGFMGKFNSKIFINIFFDIDSILVGHRRNFLQILLCLSRICCIYTKSSLIVKRVDKNIYIYLDKKPDLLKDYVSCILLKKITDCFKNNWQIQKLEKGTLFKYTLFEDR